MITKSAKEFLVDPNRSSKYIKTANQTVSEVMTAIETKVGSKMTQNTFEIKRLDRRLIVKVKISRLLPFRIRVAIQLLRLGAWIGDLGLEIEDDLKE